MKKISARAQSLTEIALILATVGLAFIGMDMYIRRGLQARVKDLTDTILGKEQYAYTSDVSGLSVLESGSDTSINSTATLTTLPKGEKQTTKDEDVSIQFSSKSEYIP